MKRVCWQDLDALPRHDPAKLSTASIPTAPGVYAWYRDGLRVYVGKARCLCDRLKKNHLCGGKSMTNSAFRRNVAEYLGIASAADIESGRRTLTMLEVERVKRWIAQCSLTWCTCQSETEAIAVEDDLKTEFKPPLTKL